MQLMSESSLIHTKLVPPFTLVPLARFSMKLATVLHSLGLTGSVLDLSKTVITVDTYIKKETPIAISRLLANIGSDGINSHGALVLYLLPSTAVTACTPGTSFSFMSRSPHRRA